jgi:hypothetical protein
MARLSYVIMLIDQIGMMLLGILYVLFITSAVQLASRHLFTLHVRC